MGDAGGIGFFLSFGFEAVDGVFLSWGELEGEVEGGVFKLLAHVEADVWISLAAIGVTDGVTDGVDGAGVCDFTFGFFKPFEQARPGGNGGF